MGSYKVKDEKRIIPIKVDRAYDILKTEVTQETFFKVTGYNPSYFKYQKYCKKSHVKMAQHQYCPRLPVENITRKDALYFLSLLNKKKDGYHYKLPNYFEWDKAARGIKGSSQFEFELDMYKEVLDKVSWYKENSEGQAREVKSKKANALGIYDLRGNVWEILEEMTDDPDITEIYERSIYKMKIKESGRYLLMRGGAWYYKKYFSNFFEVSQELRNVSSNVMGFRIVRVKR